MRHSPIIKITPLELIANLAVFQIYFAWKAVKVVSEATFLALQGRELGPCQCRHCTKNFSFSGPPPSVFDRVQSEISRRALFRAA